MKNEWIEIKFEVENDFLTARTSNFHIEKTYNRKSELSIKETLALMGKALISKELEKINIH